MILNCTDNVNLTTLLCNGTNLCSCSFNINNTCNTTANNNLQGIFLNPTLFPLYFALLGIIVYGFGRLMTTRNSEKVDSFTAYFLGAVFVIVFVVMPAFTAFIVYALISVFLKEILHIPNWDSFMSFSAYVGYTILLIIPFVLGLWLQKFKPPYDKITSVTLVECCNNYWSIFILSLLNFFAFLIVLFSNSLLWVTGTIFLFFTYSLFAFVIGLAEPKKIVIELNNKKLEMGYLENVGDNYISIFKGKNKISINKDQIARYGDPAEYNERLKNSKKDYTKVRHRNLKEPSRTKIRAKKR